ncbi:hypothetical protein SA496_06050 [Pseudomonas sp. JS3066]|jgi:hypothetical protein|uniref:hypothetical protein n=1 Tax=unclassified Pseudomonas TaxID=196821 RepID=UPI000EA8462C|nr:MULTISPECIES: hypothetical protein [unclassified Pseudomonas]AYF87689.1 hypothetical protein D6Z43_11215 [Pseudomonas sp. DY-1]MDH4655466.1 hypothetical protein [Pseudomonas sp. BN606]MRK20031.1 hypothetical protein [Pseudomonas sp. JG-B]WVK94750.1 hypothetical protein SA496_06050 [Pseudomonas sp. JS3066]
MSACKPTDPASRRQFHEEHAGQARDEALRLLAQRDAMGPRWLAWVATELYHLKPSAFANMVRRELERLNTADLQFGQASKELH